MRIRYLFLVLIVLMTFIFLNCKKDKIIGSNELIKGWKIDSISFNYNWISPRGVFFKNQKTGYFIGFEGEFIKTSDSAKSWILSKIDTDNELRVESMSFINDSIGYIYSPCRLYKTVNGGKTWTKIYYRSSDEIVLMSLKFFDINNGIALNRTYPNTNIIITNNGGINWKVVNLDLNPNIFDLYYSGEICFAPGKNFKILKSKDYGKTWVTINTPHTSIIGSSDSYDGLYFINEYIGFIFKNSGEKYKTTDGGNTWKEIHLNVTGYYHTFHFCNLNEGIIIADTSAYQGCEFPQYIGSYIYTTTDCGNNWIKSDLLQLPFGIIYFLSDNFAYCTNNKYIYTLQKN